VACLSVFVCGVQTKNPAVLWRGFEKALMITRGSVAQSDRPAEAGMMVPVVVREAEHLP
jgi:hypothetical protein